MGRRKSGRKLNAIVLLDKPQGITSNKALQEVRWLYQAQKAGHTGSLDPMATGVLPICFGEATKFAKFGLDADKGYIARARLGETTETGDAEGTLVDKKPVPALAREVVEQTLLEFKGEIKQVPSMYSALKHKGKPLYEYARQGIDIDRPARTVIIHEIQLIEFNGTEIEFFVRCSKGTYIRSLAEDIGRRIGCGAHLIKLRRTLVDQFGIDQAVELEELKSLKQQEIANPTEQDNFSLLDKLLLPVDALIEHFPKILLKSEQSRSLLQGQTVRIAQDLNDELMLRAYCEDSGRFLGIVKTDVKEDVRIVPCRLVAE